MTVGELRQQLAQCRDDVRVAIRDRIQIVNEATAHIVATGPRDATAYINSGVCVLAPKDVVWK